MKVTVDANVLFSAFIKEGLSRRLIFHADLEVNAPYFILTELLKYKPLLMEKSGLNEKDFSALTEILFRQIEIVDEKELKPYIRAADGLIDDEKDLLYAAAALYSGSAILSNDKGLRRQNRIKIYSVTELARELKIIS